MFVSPFPSSGGKGGGRAVYVDKRHPSVDDCKGQ